MTRSSKLNDLDRLVTQHLPSTLLFATRLTRNSDEAEEVVQNALVKVAKSWQSFRGEAEFRTWLFRIVINVFRDRLAASKPAVNALPAEMADDRIREPVIEAQHIELGELIAAHVSSLPPRQREVMVLSAYEGFVPKEIAALLGINEANVYAILRVARERLKKELAPYFAER